MSRPPDHDDALEALTGEVASWLALASPAAAPSEALTARIERSVATTHRFEDLEGRVAELLDVTPRDAAAMLLSIDDPSRWVPAFGAPTSAPVELLHASGGPAVAGAVTGFVRMAPGTAFPEHEHVGEETVLLLSGSCEDASGEVFHRGDVARMRPGTRHHLRAIGTVRLVFLAVIEGGLVVDGVTLGPGDPRA